MTAHLVVRPLSPEELSRLEAGLRSHDAFTLRRCQILLASAKGYGTDQIAEIVGCTPMCVRNAIYAFHGRGIDCLQELPRCPKVAQRGVPDGKLELLRGVLHQSPRAFGKPKSTWTLGLIAEVCFERGITERRLSNEAIRCTLNRMKIGWKRAKLWMTSPDPHYAEKKARRDELISSSDLLERGREEGAFLVQ